MKKTLIISILVVALFLSHVFVVYFGSSIVNVLALRFEILPLVQIGDIAMGRATSIIVGYMLFGYMLLYLFRFSKGLLYWIAFILTLIGIVEELLVITAVLRPGTFKLGFLIFGLLIAHVFLYGKIYKGKTTN